MVVLINFFVNYIVLRLTVKSNFYWETDWPDGQCTGLQVKRPGYKTWLSQCVVFSGKTLYSHSASPPPLPPGVYMSICELSGKPDEIVEEGETL